MLTLSLDFWWLPQEVTASFKRIGIAQLETPTESVRQTLTNATDELRVDDQWDVVDKAVQRN